MTSLFTTPEIEVELDELEKNQPDESDAAWLLLQELYENRELLAELKAPEIRYGHLPLFEFKVFEAAMNLGYCIYILKYYEPNHGHLCGQRIFFGHNPNNNTYYALAIAPRVTAYRTDLAGFSELCRRYEFYRIPRIS